jgi:hypothetical protein
MRSRSLAGLPTLSLTRCSYGPLLITNSSIGIELRPVLPGRTERGPGTTAKPPQLLPQHRPVMPRSRHRGGPHHGRRARRG